MPKNINIKIKLIICFLISNPLDFHGRREASKLCVKNKNRMNFKNSCHIPVDYILFDK